MPEISRFEGAEVEPHLAAAQQYFPTYKLDVQRAEIGLREYDLAAKALEADQKSLTAASGIALFFSGTAVTLVGTGSGISSLSKLTQELGNSLEIFACIVVAFISIMAVYYFSCLQQSATYAARKIVVLRRLLGLDYGSIEMVLPMDRLDGANETFAIPMFPGWLSLQALPAIAVILLAAIVEAGVFAAFHLSNPQPMTFLGAHTTPGEVGWLMGVVTVGVLLCVYRVSLFEDHETIRLYLSTKIAKIIRLPLKDRIGHVLYRMKLSVYEARRINIKLDHFYDILVLIEDKKYFKHNGNSIISVMSAIYRYCRYRSKSGGSTIYQQLSRSNFITRFNAPIRRKLIEWMIAPWLHRQFSKRDGLDLYLCSVRFAFGVIGLPAAISHFFPTTRIDDPLSNAQKFVLIERLSNVTGTFPAQRITGLARLAKRHRLLDDIDVVELNAIYGDLGRTGRIDLRGQVPSIVL